MSHKRDNLSSIYLLKIAKVRQDTPGLLSDKEFRRLVVEWNRGLIRAKKDGVVIVEWRDPTPFPISHFGVRTAWGAKGQWKIRNVASSASVAAPPRGIGDQIIVRSKLTTLCKSIQLACN